MTEEACARETEGQSLERGLLIAGGLCAILWPLLTTAYYAACPLVAGGTMPPQSGGQAAFVVRLTELGQRPAVVSLEWISVALLLLRRASQALPWLEGADKCHLDWGGIRLVAVGGGDRAVEAKVGSVMMCCGRRGTCTRIVSSACCGDIVG